MLSLVVPTYNERHNLAPLLERLEAALAACGEPFEVIVVDDDSPDGTSELARSLQPRYPWLRVLTRKHQRDLSTAVIAGWFEARGDILGVIDGDLQHPPELLPKLAERLKTGENDLVIASRHVRGGGVSEWSLFRRVISWGATLMAGFILPGTLSRVLDPMSGFFLLRRRVIEAAPLRPVGYKILLEVLAKGEYQRVEEVPYVFQERFRGGSKLGVHHGVQYLMQLAAIAVDTGEFRRVVSYAAVGASGAVVNLGGMALLTREWGVPSAISLPAATALAIVNNFIWNDRFTFPETRRRLPGASATLARFGRFLWVVLAGALLNLLLAGALMRYLHLMPELAVACGIGVAAIWNFVLNSRVTWKVWWDRSVHLRFARAEGVPVPPREMVCNLCGGDQFVLLYSGRPAARSRKPEVFRCTSENHGDYTNILRCVNCSLVVQAPADPTEDIEDSYRAVQDPVYLREESGRVQTFDGLLDEIDEALGEKVRLPYSSHRRGRLLDVGCYTGVFLDRAHKRGWDVTGLEPSLWAADLARGRGYTVMGGLLAEHDPDDTGTVLVAERFDVITVWDVIEHFADPVAEMKRLERMLKPGGLLALSTMDVESGFARLLGRRWPWFMRMHLYYFSPETLRALLERCGLRVTEVRRHRRIVTLRYLLQKAAAQPSSLSGLLEWVARLPLLGRIHVPVNFGDIINVYAVKPDPQRHDREGAHPPYQARGTRSLTVAPLLALIALVAYTFRAGLSMSRAFYFRDLTSYFQPMPELAWKMLRQGHLPLWNPYSGFGTPLAAMADVLLYYPGTWLRFLLPRPVGLNIEIIAHFWLAAIATYALARKLRMSPVAAFTASAAFTLSGPMLSLGSMLNVLVALAWMPVVLFALLWAIEDPGAWRVLVLGAALGMQAIGGEPMFSVATAVLGLALCEWRVGRFLRVLVPAALFGMALIAVQLVPGFELLRKSIRQSHFDMPASAFWSLHPLSLLETVLPSLSQRASPPLRSMLYGAGQPYLPSLYFGMMIFALAVLALVRRSNRDVRSVAALAGLFTLFSLGIHSAFYTPFYWLLPLVRQSRYPSKMMVAVAFCLALLAGWGIEALRERESLYLGWIKWPLAAAAGLALSAALAEPGRCAWALREGGRALAGAMGTAEFLRIAASLLFFLIIVQVARSNLRLATTLAALVLALDLAVTGAEVNPAAPAAIFTTKSPLVHAVGDGNAGFRVDSDLEASHARLPLLEGWTPEAVSAFENRMVLGTGAALDGVRDARDLSPNKLYTPEFRRVRLRADDWIDHGEFSRLGALNIRYFVTSAARPLPMGVRETAVLDILTRKIAVWEIENWRPRAELPGGAASVITETPTAVTVRAQSELGGNLILRDSYDEGWHARIDGRPASVERAEMLFRSVRLAPGEHTVEFIYRPWSFVLGASISVAALLLFLGVALANRPSTRNSYRQAGSPPSQ